jgi:hypothetical protein
MYVSCISLNYNCKYIHARTHARTHTHTHQRLTAATIPASTTTDTEANAPESGDTDAVAPVGAALIKNGAAANIRWAVTSVVISALPGDTRGETKGDKGTTYSPNVPTYSRVIALGGAGAQEQELCEQEFQALVSALAPAPQGPKGVKGNTAGVGGGKVPRPLLGNAAETVGGGAVGGGGGSKKRGESGVPDMEELRVLRAVIGEFDADFNENKEVKN